MKCKGLCCNKNYEQKFDEKLKEQFFKKYKFSSLCYCCEKMYILMNIWILGKNSTKHHYLKKNIFMVT